LWRIVNLPPANCESPIANCRIPVIESHAMFTDREERSIELVGYALYPATAMRAGDFGLLTLFWRAPQGIGMNLSVSFRLGDSQDRVVYQRDSAPANGARPTIGWAPDEIVQDDVGFFVPPDTVPGVYRLVLVVYNPARGEEWMTPDGAMFALGEIVAR
jgi:hypothetical protein